jgi:hypothetical protein
MRIIGLDLVDPFDGIATTQRQEWFSAALMRLIALDARGSLVTKTITIQ